MRLKLFDKRYNRNKDFLYWHVDICTDEHFVEDQLHDFHCQKKNIVNCFKIFSICNFTMEVAIAKNDTYESFEAELTLIVLLDERYPKTVKVWESDRLIAL